MKQLHNYSTEIKSYLTLNKFMHIPIYVTDNLAHCLDNINVKHILTATLISIEWDENKS